jgi:hypothetical protein
MSENKKFNIVVASDNNLEKFIGPCIESIQRTGYEPIVYNLGGLDFGIPFEATTSDASLQKFPKKPFVIKDALSNLPKDSWLAWIDIDCIMQHSIDDAIGDYDVGLTFRKNHINSGVNFWKHNSAALSFLDKWCAEAINANGDQNGLNNMCNIKSNTLINQRLEIAGATVKVFDSRIYNNFFFKKNQDAAKILHYKSKHRHRFPFNETSK